MRFYVGQTRGERTPLQQHLADMGAGEVVQRGDLPPRRGPYFYDNRAFADWRAGQPFDEVQFELDMRWLCRHVGRCDWGRGVRNLATGQIEPVPLPPPDFIVLPDLVAQGRASLEFSASYVVGERAPLGGYPAGAPLYLAVQDGMSIAEVFEVVCNLGIGGIFVGGTLEWKIKTAAQWVRAAHRLGRPVHIGRVGTVDRLRWARRIGADSIDSSLPLWSTENLERFERGLADTPQLGLWEAA